MRLTILFILLLMSCKDITKESPAVFYGNLYTVVDDKGCEYFIANWGQGVSMVHKPKCPNHK